MVVPEGESVDNTSATASAVPTVTPVTIPAPLDGAASSAPATPRSRSATAVGSRPQVAVVDVPRAPIASTHSAGIAVSKARRLTATLQQRLPERLRQTVAEDGRRWRHKWSTSTSQSPPTPRGKGSHEGGGEGLRPAEPWLMAASGGELGVASSVRSSTSSCCVDAFDDGGNTTQLSSGRLGPSGSVAKNRDATGGVPNDSYITATDIKGVPMSAGGASNSVPASVEDFLPLSTGSSRRSSEVYEREIGQEYADERSNSR